MAARRLRLSLAALALGLCGSIYPCNISIDRDRSQGAEFDRQVQAQIPLIDDPVALGFLNDLGQQIVDGIEPQPFVYRFRIVPDASLNAFAVPGGFVYLHSGTILAAASVDELAGVLAHEIAHVKGRHWARMREQLAWQNAISQVAALGAAVATGEPGVAVAAQGLNVALQLRYSRLFEAEADRLAMSFSTRAGYDPAGLGRFFERLIAVRERSPMVLPPYLYTHPEVEGRMAYVESEAARMALPEPAANSERAFLEAQARISLLVQRGRSTLIPRVRVDPERVVPLLAEAAAQQERGEVADAIVTLRRAEALEPGDPRVPFRLAELLSEAGRPDEAIAAYRRTLTLDPTRARVYYSVGRLFGRDGRRHQAVYYLEQAMRRAGPNSVLRQRAEAAVERQSFPVVETAGLADGGAPSDNVAGRARSHFDAGDERVAWWAQLTPRFRSRRARVRVRWRDPSGNVVREAPAEPVRDGHVRALLESPDFDPNRAGLWHVEALLDEDVIDRRSFEVRPGP